MTAQRQADQRKKAIEQRCIERVTEVRGGQVVMAGKEGRWPKECPQGWDDRWPDGGIIEAGAGSSAEVTPVEVVTASEPERGDRSASMAGYAKAEREAERFRAMGIPTLLGTHGKAGFVVPLERPTRAIPQGMQYVHDQIPVRLTPVDPKQWVLCAICSKIHKRYVDQKKTALVVNFWRWMPLYQHELEWLGKTLQDWGGPFKEVWIVPDLGEVQQVLPSRWAGPVTVRP